MFKWLVSKINTLIAERRTRRLVSIQNVPIFPCNLNIAKRAYLFADYKSISSITINRVTVIIVYSNLINVRPYFLGGGCIKNIFLTVIIDCIYRKDEYIFTRVTGAVDMCVTSAEGALIHVRCFNTLFCDIYLRAKFIHCKTYAVCIYLSECLKYEVIILKACMHLQQDV